MIRENPLVSIITVVYNGAATIRRTIESVINQTYRNIEYIIIDGNSTDGTQQIISMYRDQVSCFISEDDKGIYDAMNKGIRSSHGHIIGIINSDDWYELDAVENVVQYFVENEVDLVYGRIYEMVLDGTKKENSIVPIRTIWYQMAVPHPSVFVKKQIYDAYGLFDLNYSLSSDYEFMLRLYSSQISFGFINKMIAYYSHGGVSQTQREKGRRESYEISCKYIDKCDCKKEILPLLEDIKKEIVFDIKLKQNPSKFESLIQEYFNTELDKIFIFGTGKWGKKCYETLQNGSFEVMGFLDNNCTNNSTLYGKEIKKPIEMDLTDCYILVAVKNAMEIVEQLQSMEVDKYVTINELMDYCLKKYELEKL